MGGHAGVTQFPEVGQYHFSLLMWDFFPYLSMCLRIFEEKQLPNDSGLPHGCRSTWLSPQPYSNSQQLGISHGSTEISTEWPWVCFPRHRSSPRPTAAGAGLWPGLGSGHHKGRVRFTSGVGNERWNVWENVGKFLDSYGIYGIVLRWLRDNCGIMMG